VLLCDCCYVSVVMLCVVMLCVVMLCVVMPSVVALAEGPMF